MYYISFGAEVIVDGAEPEQRGDGGGDAGFTHGSR